MIYDEEIDKKKGKVGMKLKFTIFLSLFYLMITTNFVNAQWEQLTGPYGGAVYCFAAKSGYLFAGGKNGVIRSTDNGVNWTSSNFGLTETNVTSLVCSNENLFALANGKLFISITSGNSWLPMLDDYTNNNISAFVAMGDSVFVSRYGAGLYRSTNNGYSWTIVTNFFKDRPIDKFIVENGILYAGTSNGLFYSTDSGANWVVGLALNIPIVAMGVHGKNIFVETDDNFYRSTDNGNNWQNINRPVTYSKLSSIVFSEDCIYVSSNYNGVFKSTDNGNYWSAVGENIKSLILHSMFYANNTIFAATNSDGIYYIGKNKIAWKRSNWESSFFTANSFAVNDNRIFAGTGENSIFYSDSDGKYWSKVTSAYFEDLRTIFVYRNYIYAGCSNLLRSSNNGAGWTQLNSAPGSISAMAAIDDKLYAVNRNDGLFVSTDFGDNWKKLGFSPQDKYTYCIAGYGSNIFLGTYFGIYRSTDNGVNWELATRGFWDKYFTIVYSLSIYKNAITAGTSDGIYRSTDNGNEWFHYGGREPIKSLSQIGDIIFASGNYGNFYVSSDNGANWTDLSWGLDLSNINLMVIKDNYLYVSDGYKGIWRRAISDMVTGIRHEQSNEVLDFALSANYPNPFNPSTTIQYSIPCECRIKLFVYNSLGQMIQVIEDQLTTAGVYKSVFSATNLPSGIYYYQLIAQPLKPNYHQFNASGKMILIK